MPRRGSAILVEGVEAGADDDVEKEKENDVPMELGTTLKRAHVENGVGAENGVEADVKPLSVEVEYRGWRGGIEVVSLYTTTNVQQSS